MGTYSTGAKRIIGIPIARFLSAYLIFAEPGGYNFLFQHDHHEIPRFIPEGIH